MSNTCITAAEESGITEYEAESCNGEYKCPNCPLRTERRSRAQFYRDFEPERIYRGG